MAAFSPAQPRRAKTRRFRGQGRKLSGDGVHAWYVPQGVTVVSPPSNENAADGFFQQATYPAFSRSCRNR